MRSYRISIISVVLLAAVFFLSAQNRKQMLNIATKLRQAGMYSEALPLYQKIFDEGNRSYQVISGVSQCLEKLKRYDKLIEFYNDLQRRYPARINYSVDIGRIYFLKGERDKAFEAWQAVHTKNPTDINGYRMVGGVLVQLRLYDEAIELYKLALQNADKSQTLNRDIAALYKAQLNYNEATRHYLAYYQSSPKQYKYVHQQLISMAVDDEAVKNILIGLERFANKNESDAQISECRAEMYIRSRNFESAYEIYQRLNREKPNDQFLMRFASQAKANKAFDYAIKAYDELLLNQQKQNVRLSIQLRLAGVHHHYAKWLAQKGERDAADMEVKKSLALLEIISDANSRFPEKWRAIRAKADIYQNYYRQLDEARILYQSLLQAPAAAVNADMIYYELGHVFLQQNNLDKAEQSYQKIIGKSYRKIARFRSGELFYFQGKFSQSEQVFKKLVKTTAPDDTLMNNLLSRLSFINHHKKDSVQLAAFAQAELLIRQHRESDAAQAFVLLANGYSDLAKEAAKKAAILLLNMGKYQSVETLMQNLITKYALEADIDFAYFMLAEAFARNQKYSEALETYRTILTNYPNSFYREPAREKARDLTLLIKDMP